MFNRLEDFDEFHNDIKVLKNYVRFSFCRLGD